MMPRIFAYLFVIFFSASALHADPLTCSVAHYKASPGLTAAVADNAATDHLGRRQSAGTAASADDQQRHAHYSGVGD